MVETAKAGGVRKLRGIYNPFFKNEGIGKIIHDYPEIEFETVMSASELERVIEGADILIANNRSYDEDIARVLLEKGKSLKWIQFSTAGIERAIKFGLPKGVPVCCAAGIKGRTVAEHTMALLLALYRQFRAMEAARVRREWARHELNHMTKTIEGETLLLIGFGHIGQEIARKAKAFDMHVITITRAGGVGPTVDEAYTRDKLHEVLPRADAVVLATATDSSSIRMIGARELSLMKPTAVLLNMGRGELVDEAALIDALQSKRIHAAALDVTEIEPLPPESPLWDLENVLISPHISGTGKDGYARFKEIFHENFRRFQAGEPLRYLIDWENE
ncbi:MAG: D-2-hydroxyacid dehydrogenase [Beijerinckiaceae bacterium]|nr:D-2-hydroxyacid dehydrogenase [Beijerinckiaceae bacterium]